MAAVKASLRPAGWRDTMPPHITVLAPDRPILPPADAAAAFAGLELRLPPFNVTARRLHRFSRHRRHTFVLVPESSSMLTNLFNAVVARCNWQQTTASAKRSYHPHITLINQVSEEHLKLFERQLTSLKPTVKFECDQVALYAKQTSWPAWQEIQRLSLLRPYS